MRRIENYKSKIRASRPGVTLLLAILLLASILAICFSLATILFIEVRSSSDLLKTEPALYAANGVGEQAFFNLVRKVSNPSYISTFGNNVTLNGQPTVTSTSSPIFNDRVLAGSTFANTLNKYDFCGTVATTSGCSYGKVTLNYLTTNTGSDTMNAFLCQWNPTTTYVDAPCTTPDRNTGYWDSPDSGIFNPDGSTQLTPTTNSSVTWTLDPNQQQQLIIIASTSSASIYFSVSTFAADGTTPKGLPYVGKTSVVINTQNGTVGRKVQVLVPNYTGTPAPPAVSCPATGGNITTSGGFTIHTFTGNGTFSSPCDMNVEYLVVGGGGAGGGVSANSSAGGGGGGGEVVSGSVAVTTGNYNVVVGATAAGSGSAGNLSSFNSVTALGGGGGGSGSGINGATGGGGESRPATNFAGGAGTSGKGFAGGAGTRTGIDYAGGGGGGTLTAGSNGSPGGSFAANSGGHGGFGIASSISGVSVSYGGGGGGAAGTFPTGGPGNGGGGRGASLDNFSLTAPVAGSSNTGGGGGGGGRSSSGTNFAGGNGGSGVVIIRYVTP